MRRSRADKAITHSKIVAVAAKRFRERGIQGIGVADVMKEAGNSVGGFYKHFDSRDDLVIEALASAFEDIDALQSSSKDLPTFIEAYLKERHRDNPGAGCPVAALTGDVRHTSDAVRTIFTEGVKHTLDHYTNQLVVRRNESRKARAILLLSAAIGGLSLARAVNDKTLSRDILSSLRKELIALTQQ